VNSTRTTAVVVVLVAFAAGMVVGLTGDRVYLIRTRQYFPSRAAGQSMTKRLADRLDRELHFDPQQRKTVEGILERRRQSIDTIWSSVRPQVEIEINATNAEIDKVLNDDQRAKFKALQMQRRNRPHRGGPAGPPPPR
jgi:predicted P-loop ATPase/GTPase